MSRFKIEVDSPFRGSVASAIVYWLILGTGLSILSANHNIKWTEGTWQDAFTHAFVHGSWIGAVVGLMAAQLVLKAFSDSVSGQVRMREGFLGRVYLYLFEWVAYILVWPVVVVMTRLGWLRRGDPAREDASR